MADDTSRPRPEPEPTPITQACGCNFTIASPQVVAEPRYSAMGTLTLVWGVTARPKAIDFRCTKCGKTIHTARDEQTIRRHMN